MAIALANAVEGQTRLDQDELNAASRRLKAVAVASSNPTAAMATFDAAIKTLRKTQEDRRKALG